MRKLTPEERKTIKAEMERIYGASLLKGQYFVDPETASEKQLCDTIARMTGKSLSAFLKEKAF